MGWKKEVFGTLENGAQVDRYTLTNGNGVSASFTNLGGIWLSMLVPDKSGEVGGVRLGRGCVEECITPSGSLGVLVGRPAHRIDCAGFSTCGTTCVS